MRFVKPSSIVVALACLFLACGNSFTSASNIYIAQNSTGAANGTNCANAYSVSFFNNSGNWGTGLNQIGPGTSVHLCGIFNAPAGASGYLTFQGSGRSGNPVKLVFENKAVIQAAYWGANGAIYAQGVSYVVVDGGSNGLIEATSCGTGQADCQNSTDPKMSGIAFLNCSSSMIKNVTISSVYVHTTATISGTCASKGRDECGQNSYGIYWVGGSNSQIKNNMIHDAKWCVYFGYPGGTTTSNVTIGPGNTIYNCDHDAIFGDGNLGAIGQNLTIQGNTLHDWSNWDDALNYNHHDGIHIWAVHSGSTMSGMMIYNNYIYGNGGIGINSWIFDDDESGGSDNQPQIFNNVLADGSTASHQGCGMICNMAVNPIVVNNTVVGPGTSQGQGMNFYGRGVTFENNVVENIETAVEIEGGSTITDGDYNDYYKFSSGGGGNGFNYRGGTWTGILAKWQSVCGCDSHSITSNPDLASTFVPHIGSALVQHGADLSRLRIMELDSDKTGLLRPTGTCTTQGTPTCWTIGAYQLARSAAQSLRPD
jgi:hypothetical protein